MNSESQFSPPVLDEYSDLIKSYGRIMYSEIDDEFSPNWQDDVPVNWCASKTPMLTGEIRIPSYEVAFVIYHFLSFMFSAFSIIMLLATGNFVWTTLSFIGLLGANLMVDFPILILHSHVVSDKLLLYRRHCYFQTSAILYHLSWLISLLAIPIVIVEAIHFTYDTIDIIFWSYLLGKVVVSTTLIVIYHIYRY